MKVIVNGKEEEREVVSVEGKNDDFIFNKGYQGPYFAVPRLFNNERFVRTIDGKVIIIKDN